MSKVIYRHADGGLYVYLGETSIVDGGGTPKRAAVMYASVETGEHYTTTRERWDERFEWVKNEPCESAVLVAYEALLEQWVKVRDSEGSSDAEQDVILDALELLWSRIDPSDRLPARTVCATSIGVEN